MLSERDLLLEKYRARVASYADVSASFHDDWLTWCRTVLAHGGDLVVPPLLHPEPDLDLLLGSATLQGLPAKSLEQGGDCHAQVSKLWIDGDIDTIGTGYALNDGLWRQHSWGLDQNGAILETKWSSELYLGVTLPPGVPTVLFVLNNYDGDIKVVLRNGTRRATDIIEILRATSARPPGAR